MISWFLLLALDRYTWSLPHPLLCFVDTSLELYRGDNDHTETQHLFCILVNFKSCTCQVHGWSQPFEGLLDATGLLFLLSWDLSCINSPCSSVKHVAIMSQPKMGKSRPIPIRFSGKRNFQYYVQPPKKIAVKKCASENCWHTENNWSLLTSQHEGKHLWI